MSSEGHPPPFENDDLKVYDWERIFLDFEGQLSYDAQQLFLKAHPELLMPAARQYLAESIRTAFRADVQRALKLSDLGLLIADALQDQHELALGMRAKANALSLVGQHKDALALFSEAAQRFQAADEAEEVGRTLSTSIRSYLLLGDYAGAFTAASEARAIFVKLGEPLRIARLEINVANIYHRQNRFAEALDTYELAYRQLLPHADFEAIGVVLHNVGVCRIALDDFRGALEAYSRLRDLCDAHGMPLLVAQADYNSASLFFLRGDFTQALKLLRSTREVYRKNGDDYHLGLCDLDQSEIYLQLGLSEEAVEMAQGSYDRFEKLGTRYEIGRSLANLAIALGQQGRFARALDRFKSAKDVFLAEGNLAWPSLLDLYRSLMLFGQGNLDEAEDLCKPTVVTFRSVAMPGKELQALLLLSRIALRKQDLPGAADLNRQSLKLVGELELPALAFQAWLLEGELQEALGDSTAAFDAYQKCRQTLETLRGGLHADELKIGLMKSRVEVYGKLVNLCLRDRSDLPLAQEEAFRYVEEARSRSLRDLIFRTPDGGRQHASASDGANATQLETLRKELNWYYHRIEREQLSKDGLDLQQVETLRQQARTRERELLRLERESPSAWDETPEGQRSRPVSLREVCSSLKPSTILVEYFAIGDAISAAVVSCQELKIVPLTNVNTIQHHLRLLNFQMNKFRLGPDYRQRFGGALLSSTQFHLQALYRALIAPIRSLLEAEHLVIVPWGPLHALPFHALMDSDGYLIERFSFSYSPSASIFSLPKPSRRKSTNRSLILGVDSETTPHVRGEAQAVAEAVAEPELLIGQDATEENLRRRGADCKLIHIATHGYFRQDNPMFSAIRLADSYLSLYDLYHMELPVDLLTLSGCVTGMNEVTGGDELVGLVRGLFFAGANSLLLSLWDVDDRSTAEFMGLFYTNLNREPRTSEALRTAMLRLMDQNPHPYFWAPFKLTGTAESL